MSRIKVLPALYNEPRKTSNPIGLHSPGFTDRQIEALDEKDAPLLELAAEKLVRFGQRVGVTPEEIISLLDSGITLRDLLAFLVSKSSGDA